MACHHNNIKAATPSECVFLFQMLEHHTCCMNEYVGRACALHALTRYQSLNFEFYEMLHNIDRQKTMTGKAD